MAKKGKKKRGNGLVIALAIIAVLVILGCAVLAAGYFVLIYYKNTSQYIADEQVSVDYDYAAQAIREGVMEEDEIVTLSADEEKELKARFSEIESEEADTVGTYSVLLIGSDRRSTNWYGNSDAMILATVNDNTKKIYLVSFMRDLYADIPGVGVRKLNAAHANGGGPLLVTTIENNYGIEIDNYATVDFESMATIVDLVGGVDIDVSIEEASVANNYINEICQLRGLDPSAYQLQGGGVIHLNGIQAVSYGRIRYVGNADYERTSRQREILNAIAANAKNLSIGQLTELAKQMLPLVTHNLDEGTILNLIAKIPDVMNYEIVTDRVPFDGLYYSSNEMLIPDLEATIERLRALIYAKE